MWKSSLVIILKKTRIACNVGEYINQYHHFRKLLLSTKTDHKHTLLYDNAIPTLSNIAYR